ncbi:MAG: NAD(P)-binding protein [Proteobacteria bacterium]|nr:NAD(P)-binding protein [Pseudomonadota bacterium]
MPTFTDRELGLDRPIDRRDFLGGVALGAAGLALGAARADERGPATAPPPSPRSAADYPPARTGLRGQYPGSFEDAHRARDGAFSGELALDDDTGERYDLVVVGAGISGLAAAHFYRRLLGEGERILILDNHDDFGGHAKRNEFHHGGQTYLAAGGTLDIDTPYFPYSYTARALLAELGIDAGSYARHLDPAARAGLGEGFYFDREHFAGDRLVAGYGERPWPDFFAAAPLDRHVRESLTRLYTARVDLLPALDPPAKAERLKRISYQTFLLEHAGLDPRALPFFAGHAGRNNKRIDTCPALEAARNGWPGFAGMAIDDEPVVEPELFFHFPDGNATIARLLVNRLVPAAAPGALDMESVALAPFDYGRLDQPEAATRIRLESTVVRVAHAGPVDRARAVEVVYARRGRCARVHARNVLLACHNNIIRHIVPGLPPAQQAALGYASKVPMQYTNVLLRDRRAFQRLGVGSVQVPNGYHTWFGLVPPVSLGAYRPPTGVGDPVVVQLVRNPNRPGLPRKEQQRLGRADMLATPFEAIEREVRAELARVLGAGGFDPVADVLALTVNRWPHGYAYTYDTLADPDFADGEQPHVRGRQRYGRISIANADAGAAAFTNTAIDQAERAVQDLLAARGWT